MSNHVFDREKWRRMDLFWQLGNIGSEVGRALRAKAAGRTLDMHAAFYRGLDLIDATLESPSMNNQARKRELGRMRELFAESIVTDKEYPGLEEYFMQYAIAARLRQGL